MGAYSPRFSRAFKTQPAPAGVAVIVLELLTSAVELSDLEEGAQQSGVFPGSLKMVCLAARLTARCEPAP